MLTFIFYFYFSFFCHRNISHPSTDVSITFLGVGVNVIAKGVRDRISCSSGHRVLYGPSRSRQNKTLIAQNLRLSHDGRSAVTTATRIRSDDRNRITNNANRPCRTGARRRKRRDRLRWIGVGSHGSSPLAAHVISIRTARDDRAAQGELLPAPRYGVRRRFRDSLYADRATPPGAGECSIRSHRDP